MNNEHPWRGTRSTKERKALKQQMMEWLKQNPSTRLRRGAIRAIDDKVFWNYQISCVDGEQWVDKNECDRLRAELCARTYLHEKEPRRWANKMNRQKARFKARYKSDPDFRAKRLAETKIGRERNPHILTAAAAKYRVKKRNQKHHGLDQQAATYIYSEAVRLTDETGILFVVDHIVPVSKGGFHHHENLQVVPYWINSQKGGDPLWRSKDMAFRDWRDVSAELWPDQLRGEYSKQMRREPDYLLTG